MNYKIFILVWACIFPFSLRAQDDLLPLLKSELKYQYEVLKQKDVPLYYLSYLVVDKQQQTIEASFGDLQKNKDEHNCRMFPQIRLGSPELDNFAVSDMGVMNTRLGFPVVNLPIGGGMTQETFRNAIQEHVNGRYWFARECYAMAQSSPKGGDDAGWFSTSPVEKHYEAPIAVKGKLLPDEWEDLLKKVTAEFKNYPYLQTGTAVVNYVLERRYFVNTEGTEVVQNLPAVRLTLMASVQSEDGMSLPLYRTYFGHALEELPGEGELILAVKELASQLKELREAPLADAYSGPVLLSGTVSAVCFHEIFGHQVEGQRLKRIKEGQSFKEMVGKSVLPSCLQVYDDPTLKEYQKQKLSGYYQYDDQGVKAERVDVVKDGVLNHFLMTRIPLKGEPRSNGHARTEGNGADPVSRQSNLIVETSSSLDEAQMREKFKEELNKAGKAYGYYVKEVSVNLKKFTVVPLVVYRVYADGRPDQLVRGAEFEGLGWDLFTNIVQAGGPSDLFRGMCEAESGKVPVTTFAPMLLVNNMNIHQKAIEKNAGMLLSAPKN